MVSDVQRRGSKKSKGYKESWSRGKDSHPLTRPVQAINAPNDPQVGDDLERPPAQRSDALSEPAPQPSNRSHDASTRLVVDGERQGVAPRRESILRRFLTGQGGNVHESDGGDVNVAIEVLVRHVVHEVLVLLRDATRRLRQERRVDGRRLERVHVERQTLFERFPDHPPERELAEGRSNVAVGVVRSTSNVRVSAGCEDGPTSFVLLEVTEESSRCQLTKPALFHGRLHCVAVSSGSQRIAVVGHPRLRSEADATLVEGESLPKVRHLTRSSGERESARDDGTDGRDGVPLRRLASAS